MNKTIVQVECVSKKETKNYDPKKPKATTIELQVPYDHGSIFYQLSGGSLMNLNTVNQEAADMFQLGGKYNIEISPAPAPSEE